jgi:mono/diheme cytochrome c family protein
VGSCYAPSSPPIPTLPPNKIEQRKMATAQVGRSLSVRLPSAARGPAPWRFPASVGLSWLLWLTCHPTGLAAATDAIDFNRDVRPILSSHCFACHGPAVQEAGLRLDIAESAVSILDSGVAAVVAGDPNASQLIERIRSDDPDIHMPPPESHKRLSPQELHILERWIAEGAAYAQPWAFTTPQRPSLPDLPAASLERLSSDDRQPFDLLLLSQLEAAGLPVNRVADRRTLIRRASLALTGLPPTQQEVARFVADPGPDAYLRLIDRLLASPSFGQEMARVWLDLARYADTHGLHLDNERQMWLYRDWVVEAFNRGLAYDRFVVEQLAGDLLPEPSIDQLVATGFNRCNVTTSEGGSINEELLFRYAVDRTSTTMEVFMGLTGQCAVCHDHKFDPISAREFYQLYAFFNSAGDPGFDGNALLTRPTVQVPSRQQQRLLERLEQALAEADSQLTSAADRLHYDDPAEAAEPHPVEHSETLWLDDDFPSGARLQASPAPGPTWIESDVEGVVFRGRRSLERSADGIGQDFYDSGAAPLEIGPQSELFVHVWLDPERPPQAIMLQLNDGQWSRRAVWGDYDVIGWGDPGTVQRVAAGPLPPLGQWTRLAIPAERLELLPGQAVQGFALTQYDGRVRWDAVGIRQQIDPSTDPGLSLAAWWRQRLEVGPDAWKDLPSDLHAALRAGPQGPTDGVAAVRRFWFTNLWRAAPETLRAAVDRRSAAQQQLTAAREAIPSTFIYQDLEQPRPSFVMVRGNYNQPGEPVMPGVPAFLPSLESTADGPPSRLDLAHWLVDDRHPLTARVAVNRLWQQLFGTGIVASSSDFGAQGEPPTHPELIDWLAIQLREGDWEVKPLIRQLVSSDAFQRSSQVLPEQLEADPANRLLARGPRWRLDAEQLRDTALMLSGRLDRTFGGPGVKPYQPENIWEPVGFVGSNTRNYRQDSGQKLYRRSIYTFLKRTAPPPFMINFDAPNRENSCAARERSNTPLQSLQLMNDIQYVEAARGLAERVLSEAGSTDSERLGWLWLEVLGRPAGDDELDVAQQLIDRQRKRYTDHPADAAQLVAVGESEPRRLERTDLAAWTVVASMLMNLDETVCRN